MPAKANEVGRAFPNRLGELEDHCLVAIGSWGLEKAQICPGASCCQRIFSAEKFTGFSWLTKSLPLSSLLWITPSSTPGLPQTAQSGTSASTPPRDDTARTEPWAQPALKSRRPTRE